MNDIDNQIQNEITSVGQDNKKSIFIPRRLYLERYQEILSELKEKFPLLFAQEKIRIMKKQIHLDLIAQTSLSKNEIRSFLYQYCNSKKYIKAHKEGALRYDLQGNEIEEVTAQELENKQRSLKEAEERRQECKEVITRVKENSINDIESN